VPKKAPALAPGIIIIIIIVVLILSTFTAVLPPAFSQSEKGAYIDQVRFIHREDENLALQEVRSGDLDMYYFRIPLEVAGDAQDDSRLKVYDRIAGSQGLLVNPAPAKDSSMLNPFQFREARYALNYLVDREFIINEVFKGYGSPMVEPFGIYSPEYLNVIDIVESFGFRYNPRLAESMIAGALESAGATKDEDGKWMYKGNPITVKILIRQDDASRKSMGEVVASELEKIGFAVQREYGDLNKANTIVYSSDPAELQWHIYTEGFAGTAAFVKYNPVVPAQMYGAWYGRMPGAQNPAFWNYQNSTLDEITQRIMFFNFTSEQERNELVRQAVTAGVQESVRIFIAQMRDPFIASSRIQGLVNDFGAGITSKYSLLNVRPADGGTSLDVGMKQIHQGSWNTIAGLQDAYSTDIYSAITDAATSRNPYTGEIIPLRTEWTDISTEGPHGMMDVPSDALKWDPASQQWKQVGENNTAISRVIFKPVYSNWHHGIPMDGTDLMYGEYFTFEWGTNSGEGDLTVDPEYTSRAQVVLPLIKGFKFTGPDQVENYIDIWHYDETEIGDRGVFWAGEPWEITAASERLVTDGKLAYSKSQAIAKNVEWYDPIVPDHALMIRDELQKMKSENFVPAALRGIVSAEDAIRRYDASIQWINDHNHAIISNGPFYLDSYNIAGRTITIKATNDSSYPFEVGHWSKFATPRLADISKVDGARLIQIGKPAAMTVSVQVDGQPSSEATVNYFILDKNGKVAVKGEGEPAADSAGVFSIELPAEETSKLSPGPNRLRIFANSDYAFRPDISETTILAAAAAATTSGNSSSSSNNNDQTPVQTGGSGSQEQTPTQSQPSGCLIATAAFGSELTPQVQYLRNFREHYILSTTSGAAFMNAFNSVYYSLSPQVADYEREQPWLQATVKTGLYPLFGILMASERAHSAVGGEAGAILAGATASMLIGAVYLWPAALSTRLQSRFSTITKISLIVLSAAAALVAIGIASGNVQLLSASTSLFVLSIATASAMLVGRLARKGVGAIITAGKQNINRK
jgi:peptide/nickel transport system substrate-binding protein